MDFADVVRMGSSLIRNTWIAPRPYLLYFKPTDRCDCRCRTCDRWQRPSQQNNELSTDEVRVLLARFRALGATVLVLWGGEPLMREDLGEILTEAKALGYRTSMCTNGRLLHRRAGEVLPHLDTVLCSLDGFGVRHDQQRGIDGLFERVVEGLKSARENPRMRVKIWASVHAENLDDLEPLARLARDLGVWVEYFPIARVPAHNDALVLEAEGLEGAFARVLELKRAGYPVWNSERSIVKVRDSHELRCNFGRIALQVDSAGHVHSCEAPDGTALHSWGRYDAVDWEQRFRSKEFAAAREQLSHCDLCRLPCVVELSDGLVSAYAEMFWQSVTKA
jgi:MoaA/NifB/PqqE/SkfB family radical SAM enzyme